MKRESKAIVLSLIFENHETKNLVTTNFIACVLRIWN